VRTSLFSVLAIATLFMVGFERHTATQGSVNHSVTKADVDRWMTELSNWGRWGKDDQKGTINLLTPDRRKKALAAAREGVSVSLSHTYIEEREADATSPFGRQMLPIGTGDFVSDRFTVSFHGYAHSHMDSLCHMSHDGRMYNGFARTEVTEAGCAKLAISNFKQGIVARGVLLDIARLKGVKYLDAGAPIYAEDLEAAERNQHVKVGPGDVLLIRNGRWARRAELGAWNTAQRGAGLHGSVLPWLKARDIAVLGSDTVNDVLPSQVDGVVEPIHQVVIIAMGTPLFDNLDLEAVADEAAKRGRWEFLLTGSPLAVETGTGSPLNPLAIF
jgi:kynurenine formamidase